jgi:translation initiation factor 3 subunit M
MALIAVASRAAGGAVALSEVQAALDIPEDQVQPWIVRAIGKRLIEGKIDQVAGTVTATRCLRRAFSSNDWAALAQRLKGLGSGLSAIAERLGAQQQGAQQQHGGAAFGGGAKPAGVRA